MINIPGPGLLLHNCAHLGPTKSLSKYNSDVLYPNTILLKSFLQNEALTGSYFLHAFINHKTKVNDGEMT